MNRTSRSGQKSVVDLDHVDQLEPAIRANQAGRCQVDQIEADPLLSGHTWHLWSVRNSNRRIVCLRLERNRWTTRGMLQLSSQALSAASRC